MSVLEFSLLTSHGNSDTFLLVALKVGQRPAAAVGKVQEWFR